MIIYIVVFGFLLYKLEYLEVFMIKDYILWILFGFIPVMTEIVYNYKTITVKHIIIDTVKFSIIPLYIINSYTMSLLIELLIIPISIICSGIVVICNYKDVPHNIKKVFNYGLIIINSIMIYHACKYFVINISDIKSINFLKNIIMEILCIIGMIPIILYLRLYMLYEQVGINMVYRCKLNKWIIYLVIFKNCLLSRLKLIYILENRNEFYRIKSWKELDNRVKIVLSCINSIK